MPESVKHINCIESIALVIMTVCLAQSSATVLRVPQEFATIQSALDSVGETDTVLVAFGVYHESLLAPGIAFHLIGDVPADSGLFPRPIVDPAPLPGSDSLLCMRLPAGCAITCEKMTFRMGPQGYPRRPPWPMFSGICDSSRETVTFRHCMFDSLAGAIQPCSFRNVEGPFSIRVEHCLFIDPTYSQMGTHGGIHASDCLFTGNGEATFGQHMAGCGSNSIYERCHFTGRDFVQMFTCSGSNNRVRECIFGPSLNTFSQAAYFISRGECFYEYNLFIDNEVHSIGVKIYVDEGEPPVFAHNTFRGNHVEFNRCLSELAVNCDPSVEWLAAVIESNVFEPRESGSGGNCGPHLVANAIISTCPIAIQYNRFLFLSPSNLAAVYADTFAAGTILRDNMFFDNEFGVYSPIAEVDARWNYWGDSTGPFNELDNPDGQGDEVRGNVLFIPWYPDTSFLDTPLRTKHRVTSYVLRTYPNPFNATATLRLEIPDPGIFRIELFDVLGRKVRELWSGPVADEMTIRIDGSALASGIYYARAWQTTHNRPVVTAKLVLMK